MRSIVFTTLASSLVLVPAAFAQSFTTGPCHNDGNHWMSENHACELRSTTLPLQGGRVAVEGRNGGIELIGEDRNDIALEAQVQAQAHSREEAEAILHQVRVETNGTIRADGPEIHDGGWSVNFKLHVPRRIAAELDTRNGGISLSNLDGTLHAQTQNGGLNLTNLAGDVQATTVNGGVHVVLAGDTWHGTGFSARSTNGGVHVQLPADYSAHLIAGTVNGGAHISRGPSGDAMHARNYFDGNLGHGGPTVRVQTTNGGITVD